jgi:hydroxymethylpyrimidine pyrophosphatase-like HAD family hydrolase
VSGLILFDWDNTITIADDVSQMNDDRFKSVIQTKINEGWHIGLSSNTPLKRLQSWWGSLGMNGPIVAEKGAIVWWPNIRAIQVSQSSEVFSAFRNEVILTLARTPDVGFLFGDNAEFIRSVNKMISNDSIFVALDAYRICSLGLFVRKIRDNLLVKDHVAAETILELITPILPSHPLISQIDLNLEWCFLGVNPLDADKSSGVRVLLEKWAMTPEVIMVGDSIADYVDLPQVRHFAVGNAQPAFKSRADRIATRNYTQGCVELLSSI